MRVIQSEVLAIVSARSEPGAETAEAPGMAGYSPDWGAECAQACEKLGIHINQHLGLFRDAYIAVCYPRGLALIPAKVILWISINRQRGEGFLDLAVHVSASEWSGMRLLTFAAWYEPEPTEALSQWWRQWLGDVERMIRGVPAKTRAGAP